MSQKKKFTQGTKSHTKQQNKRTANNFQFWWVIVIVIILVSGGYWVSKLMNSPTETATLPREITVEEAYQKYNEGVFLLDVRTQEEWNDFHAPNTTLIPLDQLASRLSEVPEDQEIVVICRSGNRSQQGRDILLQAGFEEVTSMAGGLNEWRATGYPTVSGP